jgi:hypothetical protein
MNDAQRDTLQRLATAFCIAIEQARAERDPAALPYFPDSACGMTSRLFARPGGGVTPAAPSLLSARPRPRGQPSRRPFFVLCHCAILFVIKD